MPFLYKLYRLQQFFCFPSRRMGQVFSPGFGVQGDFDEKSPKAVCQADVTAGENAGGPGGG